MKLNPPIQFPVLVNGIRKTAFLDAQAGKDGQSFLHIYFSDGYEDFFFQPENGGLYGSKPESRPYEDSLRMDSTILPLINSKRFYYTFQEVTDGIMTNIWIQEIESVPGKISYAIYFNNSYRFEVMMKVKSRWVVFTISTVSKDIDPVIAQRVREVLDLLMD